MNELMKLMLTNITLKQLSELFAATNDSASKAVIGIIGAKYDENIDAVQIDFDCDGKYSHKYSYSDTVFISVKDDELYLSY